MLTKESVPCGNPIIRIDCMFCDVIYGEDINCGIKNKLELYKTDGYCESSDSGKKCIECSHYSFEMDDCRHNDFVAAVYRFVHNITEDDRHFEPGKGRKIILRKK
jgi:hypothetical protein